MEFRPRTYDCIRGSMPVHELPLQLQEIPLILNTEYLYDNHSLFLIEPDGQYEDSRRHGLGSVPEQIEQIAIAYRDGYSVIVKDLENWSTRLQSACAQLGPNVNVHLYLSGPVASSLDWHADDRDVQIVMIHGEKVFLVENANAEMLRFELKAGDTPPHPVWGPTQSLNFGHWVHLGLESGPGA
ncbi:MAG: hypothetical protein KF789_08500 [Bdellovibrionaceae bacterium]|nr:hypothetical protein [Pseudobdellovibrionaceae bacterium]